MNTIRYNPTAANSNQFSHAQQQSPPSPPHPSDSHQNIGATSYITPNVQYYRQTPSDTQENVVIVPASISIRRNQISAITTNKFRIFLIISGLFTLIWSLAIIGLGMYITIKSVNTLNRDILASGYLLIGSICLLKLSCGTSYLLDYIKQVFAMTLVFCIGGLILSAIIFYQSKKCSSYFPAIHSCDKQLLYISKMTDLIVFIVASIHSLINFLVLINQNKKSLSIPTTRNH
ncbi:unnamed protein product [Adineta steineri]|uniref:Uncharacterized protein n=1 Tax=Adineta steineri TaxID=433720 RepID=A0A814LTP7_9BILA|nr:unnamed protein product [Adineta steineri]CAF1070743.1 unnamed protein product [Adineta steineri]CAF1271529.1 unnamed protein product [Adineta steineri]